MTSSRKSWLCSAAAFLNYWLLLRWSVQARPFVLLSGPEVLPDDDLAPPVVPGSTLLTAHQAEKTQEPLYIVAGSAKPFVSSPKEPLKRLERSVQKLQQPSRAKGPSVSSAADAALARVFDGGSRRKIAHRQPSLHAAKCRDIRNDVVIESGFQGYADVFSEGRAAAAWLASTVPSGTNFVLPSDERVGVFVVRTGKASSLMSPRLTVSDTSMLTVEFSETQSKMAIPADGKANVFLAKHFCKKHGAATVTIQLSVQKDESAPSVDPLCANRPAPIVFAYRKACAPPPDTLSTFRKALSVEVPEQKIQALAHRDAPLPDAPQKPWQGIIPTGGARTVLIVCLVVGFAICVYEFGSMWCGNAMKRAIIENSPHFLGVQANIENTSISLWMGHFNYTLKGLVIQHPDGNWQTPYFTKVDEVVMEFNVQRMICTFGREIEIRQLTARHVRVNVEIDGYVFGTSNTSHVLEQLDRNNKKWLDDLESIKQNHGIDAAYHYGRFEKKLRDAMEGVLLKEVAIQNISISGGNKSLGMEMAIADMEFHDFSAQHGDPPPAVGMSKIGYYLTHAVLEGLAEDIAGAEFGHGRFEGLINSFKGLTGRA